MNAEEHVQYLIIISIAIASCLLHTLLVRKLLVSNLGKCVSQRFAINSVFYICLSIGCLLVSAYSVLFDAISGMFIAFFFRKNFLGAFSSLFVCTRSSLDDERVVRFVERKRAARRASSRPRLSNFLRSSFWIRLQHSNDFRQPRRRRLFGRNYLCGRAAAARVAGELSIFHLLAKFNSRNADYDR